MTARALALAAVVLGACSAPPRVPFRVVPLGDDPFFGGTATAIAVTLERGGVRDTSSTVRFPPDATTLTLPPAPFGDGYAVVVETELSGLAIARGRSFPFSVTAAGPDRAPDVSLGVLGRFAAVGTGDAADPFVLATPTPDGAMLASRRGLARFVAHGADGRPALAAPVPWTAARVGGAPLPMDGGILVVGGAAAGATLFDPTGRALAELDAAALPIASGAALVAIDEATVLAAGGTRADGTAVSDVARIAWDGTALSVTALAPLAAPRTGARALLVVANAPPSGRVSRVLLLDGTTSAGPSTDLVLIDPEGTAAHAVVPGPSVTGAAVCALDTGLVLLAGGRDASGVSGEVTILVVQPGRVLAVEALSPAPPPLFHAREGAVATSLGPGLALIAGGRDALGAPVAEAEIAEVRLDSLPGNVVLTGTLPGAGEVTAATTLLDQTILVSTGSALALYFSPRAP